MSLLVEGLIDGSDDVLIDGRSVGNVGQFLGNGPAGDRQAVTMQQPGIEQDFQDLWDAADLVQIHSHVLA